MKSKWLGNGLALFSMFFGAGNAIFPLIVGQAVENKIFYALFGLFLTAVAIPFLGLISMTLFQGDYIRFFKRLGKYPGAVVMVVVLAVLTAFGALPRCVTLTYSTLSLHMPSINLFWFSSGSVVLIYLCCIKENKALDLLGYILTPILLVFLAIIVVKGAYGSAGAVSTTMESSRAFFIGLIEGYNTLDLLAAFFFSSFICHLFKEEQKGHASPKEMLFHLLKASAVGGVLLLVVYVGFGYVASLYSDSLSNISPDTYLGAIGAITLGHVGAFVISSAISLSCLTTAIALSIVCSDFIRLYLCGNRIPHWLSLGVTLVRLPI